MAELFAILNLPQSGPQSYEIIGRVGLTMALGNCADGQQEKHLYCGPTSQEIPNKPKRHSISQDAPGHVTLPCHNLERMARFYENIAGLERITDSSCDGYVMFRNPLSFGGHISFVTLCANAQAPSPKGRTPIHSLALSLPYEEQETMMDWFDHLQHPYKTEYSNWTGWSRLMTSDPEGNTIEMLAIGPA